MCGRLVIYSPSSSYTNYLEAVQSYEYIHSFNIPPSATIPICRLTAENTREITPARWGLVPRWSRGPDNRFSMFNARAETIHEKPAFKAAFRKQRCLVPVDGFYEWKKENGKQPFYFYRTSGQPLALAGLWDRWQDAEGNAIESCTIIVTTANQLMRPVHDRMPVILDPEQFADWLDPANSSTDSLLEFLRPYPRRQLDCHPVSRAVNSPKNDTAELIDRIL